VLMAVRRRSGEYSIVLASPPSARTVTDRRTAHITETPMETLARAPERAAPSPASTAPADLNMPVDDEHDMFARTIAEQRPEEVAKLLRSWMSQT